MNIWQAGAQPARQEAEQLSATSAHVIVMPRGCRVARWQPSSAKQLKPLDSGFPFARRGRIGGGGIAQGGKAPRGGRRAMRELCQRRWGFGGVGGVGRWKWKIKAVLGRSGLRGLGCALMNEEIRQDAGIKPTSYIFLLFMQRTAASWRGIWMNFSALSLLGFFSSLSSFLSFLRGEC